MEEDFQSKLLYPLSVPTTVPMPSARPSLSQPACLSISSWSDLDEDDFSLVGEWSTCPPEPKRGKTASSIALLAASRHNSINQSHILHDGFNFQNDLRETCISPLSQESDNIVQNDCYSFEYCHLNNSNCRKRRSIASVTTTRSLASDDNFATLFDEDIDDCQMDLTSECCSSPIAAACEDQDELSDLPDDILFRITSFLDAKSLLLSFGCVNRRFKQISRDDAAGWEHLCLTKWDNKCHVAADAMAEFNHASKFNAYRTAIEDASKRQHVTEAELCYDPQTGEGTVWSFRFKASAGIDWTGVDPWYSGFPCRKMAFLRDGSVKEAIWVGTKGYNSSSSFSTGAHIIQRQFPFNMNHNQQQEEIVRNNNAMFFNQDIQNQQTYSLGNQSNAKAGLYLQNNATKDQASWKILDPPLPMTWRFLSRPIDLPTRLEPGSYIRISVGGRDVPTYSVSRSKSGNWGFVMESCWGVWASFELPPRKVPRQVAARANANSNVTSNRNSGFGNRMRSRGPVLRRRPLQDDAVWIQVDDQDDESSISSGGTDVSDSYLQDETLLLSNEIQWREAFLYNVGARVLPEGDEAMEVFDQAWGGMYR